MYIFAIAAIMVVVCAGFAGGLLLFLRKIDPKNADTSEQENIKLTQELLPFEDIKDNTVPLGGNQFRAYVRCMPVNYDLKTQGERDLIEMEFQRFVNSSTFPYTIFIHTEVIDNTERYKRTQKEVQASIEEFPGMRTYGEQYLRDIHDLNAKIGNSLQKRHYIIVHYDEVGQLDNLTDGERIEYAKKELQLRCKTLASNLEGVGVKCETLNTAEIIELIYSSYYRDDASFAKSIVDKDAFTLFVSGERDQFEALPKEKLLSIIIEETKNKIQMEGLERHAKAKELLLEMEAIQDGLKTAFNGKENA